MKNKNLAGATVFVMVFVAILTFLATAIINEALLQSKLVKNKEIQEEAFNMAESGISYSKWFFSVFPNDTSDGTGSSGPYHHRVSEGENEKGGFYLSVNPNTSCGVLQYVDVVSQGYSDKNPSIKKSISARIMKPSIAEFSYLLNSDVWAGSGRYIVGPYHSNGGIRMDGVNNSVVSSAKSSWKCTFSFGCSSEKEVDGVFGSGPNSHLWVYPDLKIDFQTLNLDMDMLKRVAQNGGIYLPAFTKKKDRYKKGYQIIFKENGSFDLYKVTKTSYIWAYRSDYKYKFSSSYGWRKEYNKITKRKYLGNYKIPKDCSLIFSEEKVWVHGTVKGKLSLFISRPNSEYDPELVFSGNINYKNPLLGKDGLTIFSEGYIIIPEYSPNTMSLSGIFISQKGSFGRSFYFGNTKDKLTINGTVVSNGRVGTSWGCPYYFCSGYKNRVNSYDRFLRYSPPPFTPSATSTLQIVKWNEI